MFWLGRCFLTFFLSLSSSGWSNLFIISFDTLHSYASLLDTGKKSEDCPRCLVIMRTVIRAFQFQEPSCPLQAGHHFTRLKGKSLQLEVVITLEKKSHGVCVMGVSVVMNKTHTPCDFYLPNNVFYSKQKAVCVLVPHYW